MCHVIKHLQQKICLKNISSKSPLRFGDINVAKCSEKKEADNHMYEACKSHVMNG